MSLMISLNSLNNVIDAVAHGDEYVASSRQMLMSEWGGSWRDSVQVAWTHSDTTWCFACGTQFKNLKI